MSMNVSILPSGRSFTAEPGEPLLAAAIRQGIGLPYGCKDGACGSCKCRKLEGTVVHGAHQTKALSADEEAAGFILTCCGMAETDVVIESRQVTDESAFPIRKMPARVSSLRRLSPDVMGVRLQLPASDVMKYHAGQYVEFLLAGGDRRAYSMANAPHTQLEAPGIELHIRHTPGGKFTDHVFGAMKERDILRIEGPYGSFFLREDSTKPLVLLASGTGFAPADLYENNWVLAKVAEMPHLQYVPVVSNALPEDNWTGRSGFVHQAVLQDFADLSGHQVYACGAPVVVESARHDYTALAGLPADEVFADSFTSEADKAGASTATAVAPAA